MAILYGTQSNGETLPVLVDQFGNLLAKGIEGPAGPEGPPGPGGSFDLPPDPYEGALLGWEDGQLAWVGQSIILPENTYGPYTYISAEGRLNVPQNLSSLVNGQQLFMSDQFGVQAYQTISTDTIQTINVEPAWNQSQVWSNGGFGSLIRGTWDAVFGGSGERPITQNNAIGWRAYDLPFTKCRFSSRGWASITYKLNGVSITTTEERRYDDNYELDLGEGIVGQLVSCNTGSISPSTDTTFSNVYVDDKRLMLPDITGDPGYGDNLIMPTNQNFKYFQVGDIVREDGTKILSIDSDSSTICVELGSSWTASDGSGTPGGSTVVEVDVSGEGSVFAGSDGVVLLRDNNDDWIDGFFLTAPEQQIAARKAAANAQKAAANARTLRKK